MHSTGKIQMQKKTTRLTGRLFDLDGVVQLIVDQDTSAVLADDDLFALTDLALALRGDSIETATTGVPEDRYDRQTVPVIATDTIIRVQEPGLYFLARFGRQLGKMFFFFFRRGDDLVELVLLILQHGFLGGDVLLRLFQ